MIEFVKNYAIMPYLPVEFDKRVPVGYMKIKGYDLWLHEDIYGNLFFGKISGGSPRVLWFDYISTLDPGLFRVYKFIGKYNWTEGVIDKQYRDKRNMLYLKYENNNKIYWINDEKDSTIFKYTDLPKWYDYVINKYRFKNNTIFH